jgi:hypothetical protein
MKKQQRNEQVLPSTGIAVRAGEKDCGKTSLNATNEPNIGADAS